MIKTLRNLLKQDKERFVVPRGCLLYTSRSAMSEIGSRVSEEIYRRRADRSKDQER